MKRRVVSVGFLWRFVAYAAVASVIAAALVFIADSISPTLGESAGSVALLVAIFTAWHAARELPGAEVERWKAEHPAPPVVRRYYFRRGESGEVQGPDSLQEIRTRTSEVQGVEIVEATGQSAWALRRAKWEQLSTETTT